MTGLQCLVSVICVWLVGLVIVGPLAMGMCHASAAADDAMDEAIEKLERGK